MAMKSAVFRTAGFTLVETLVTTALTVLVCALVAQIATSSLNTVHIAGSRVTATEKLDQLRKRLDSDLQRVPVASGLATLTASAASGAWTLTLRVPLTTPAGQSPWQIISYRWSQDTASMTRSEQSGNTAAAPEENIIGTGITEWEMKWLASAADDAGNAVAGWSSATSTPAAAMIRASFTGAWEEGAPTNAAGAKAREFLWSVEVGG
jgi:type II secretory pathway component PulJ